MNVEKVKNQITQLSSLFQEGVIEAEDFAKYESKLKNILVGLENSPKVGDILCCSWGYSMTIVDFYKVVKITPSGKSISVVELGTTCVEGEAGYYGYLMPTDDVVGEVIKNKRIKKDNKGYSITISDYKWATKWDGKKKYFNTMD